MKHIISLDKTRSAYVLAAVCFALGMIVGGIGHLALSRLDGARSYKDTPREAREAGGILTSPLLECAESGPLPLENLRLLETAVNKYVTSRKDITMSVYFRDLRNGGWISVGDSTLYQPSSLMKLPITIAAYRRLEEDPTFFSKEVTMVTEDPLEQNIIDFEPTKIPEVVPIRELVYRAMVYSDNRANYTLAREVGASTIDKVINDFGIRPLDVIDEYEVTPREYSSLYRILYNATYLSHAHSEELLYILTQSSFKRGIVAGVPEGTVVAHKFGERVIGGGPQTLLEHQLHDCGIVYAELPYVLCVMSRGTSFDSLYDSISRVSQIVYEQTNR